MMSFITLAYVIWMVLRAMRHPKFSDEFEAATCKEPGKKGRSRIK